MESNHTEGAALHKRGTAADRESRQPSAPQNRGTEKKQLNPHRTGKLAVIAVNILMHVLIIYIFAFSAILLKNNTKARKVFICFNLWLHNTLQNTLILIRLPSLSGHSVKLQLGIKVSCVFGSFKSF